MCSECGIYGLPADEHLLFLFFRRYDRLWYRESSIGYTLPDGWTYQQYVEFPKRTTKTLVKHLLNRGLIQQRFVAKGYFRYYEYKISDNTNGRLCLECGKLCVDFVIAPLSRITDPTQAPNVFCPHCRAWFCTVNEFIARNGCAPVQRNGIESDAQRRLK